jgi:DNA-binding NarL/FixJ family response regulator
MMTPVPPKESLGPAKFNSKNLPTDMQFTDLEWALKLSEMDSGSDAQSIALALAESLNTVKSHTSAPPPQRDAHADIEVIRRKRLKRFK